MKAQINEFGQTPKQIFNVPHIQKRSKIIINKEIPLKYQSPSKTEKSHEKMELNENSQHKKSIEESKEKDQELEKTRKTVPQNMNSLNEISDEIEDLLDEAMDNLKETEVIGEPKSSKDLDELDRNSVEFMDILQEVEKMLPENKCEDQKGKEDDAYFNLVSSKSFDLKRSLVFQNDKWVFHSN